MVERLVGGLLLLMVMMVLLWCSCLGCRWRCGRRVWIDGMVLMVLLVQLMLVRMVRVHRRHGRWRWRMLGVLFQFDWDGRLGRIGDRHGAERCAAAVEWKASVIE